MTALLDAIYPGDDVTILVANMLFQISVVILLTMLAVRTFLRRTPVIAHAAWLTCLAFVALCPLVVLVANRAGISTLTLVPTPVAVEPRPAPAGPKGTATVAAPIWEDYPPVVLPERMEHVAEGRLAQRRVVEVEQPDPALTDAADSAPMNAVRMSLPVEPHWFTWRTAISMSLVAWGIGALLMALRLLHGACCAIVLRRTTGPLDASGFADVLDRVRLSTGLANLPPIVLSGQVKTPLVIAGVRPLILLPASLPHTISRNHVHDVLVHECAHVIRGDHLVGLLQRLVEIVYWLHPLIHAMNRQLAKCREEVCDNYVLAAVGPADYADTLLELATRSRDRVGLLPSIGMFGLRWNLEDRVRSLLDQKRDRSVRTKGWTRGVLFAVTVMAFVAAATLQVGVASEEEDEQGAALTVASRQKAPEIPDLLVAGMGEYLDVDGNPWRPGHDVDGELLPHGAVARMGSRRLRDCLGGLRIWILPDNKTLISAGLDGVRLWDVVTGKQSRDHDSNWNRAGASNVSHDARFLLTLVRREGGEKGKTIPKIWDTSTWRAHPIAMPEVEAFPFSSVVAVSASAKTIVIGDRNGMVRIWDTISGQELVSHSMGETAVRYLAFSPDDTLLAIAMAEDVFLWRWSSNEKPEPLDDAAQPERTIVFSPDGRLLATAHSPVLQLRAPESLVESAAQIWDVATRRPVLKMKGKADGYSTRNLSFSADGKSLIVPAHETQSVEIFDVETGQLKQILDGKCRRTAISPDGRLVAGAGADSTVKVWSLPDGRRMSDRFIGHECVGEEVIYSTNGKYVITGSHDKTLRVWDAATGRQIHVLPCEGWVNYIAASPDGRTIASCSADGAVRVWDLQSGRQVFRLPGPARESGGRGMTVSFDSSGKRLLSFGKKEMRIRVWNAATGEAIAERTIDAVEAKPKDPQDHSAVRHALINEARDPCFSADGTRLFLCINRTVSVFDTESGKEIAQRFRKDPVNECELSADGTTLVAAGRQSADSLSPGQRQKSLLKISRHPFERSDRDIELPKGYFDLLAVSHDGTLVALLMWELPSRQNFVSVWDLEAGEEVARIPGDSGNTAIGSAFSPDGTSLTTSHMDTTTVVWDLAKLRESWSLARAFFQESILEPYIQSPPSHSPPSRRYGFAPLWKPNAPSRSADDTVQPTSY